MSYIKNFLLIWALTQKNKYAVYEGEREGDTNCSGLGKGTERNRNQRKNRDPPDYIIDMNGQSTEKSPGDLG